MNSRLLAIAGLAGAAFALPAAAQVDTSSIYIGGLLGRAHFKEVCTGAVGECSARDTAWGAFAGYQFNRFLGVEVGYRAFGHAETPTGNVKATAAELDAVGTLPLLGRLGLVGRVGGFHGDLKGEGISARNNGLTFGLGAQYEASSQTAFRVEWQRYKDLGGGDFGSKIDIELLSISALMRFR